ncbi:Transcriptional regulator of nonfermentable carbon utilization [Phlyctochytrium bullatum]|nr:Transcriptional regulator of nonfermentable carbon utilization [Phlyctochytrium bullatum]
MDRPHLHHGGVRQTAASTENRRRSLTPSSNTAPSGGPIAAIEDLGLVLLHRSAVASGTSIPSDDKETAESTATQPPPPGKRKRRNPPSAVRHHQTQPSGSLEESEVNRADAAAMWLMLEDGLDFSALTEGVEQQQQHQPSSVEQQQQQHQPNAGVGISPRRTAQVSRPSAGPTPVQRTWSLPAGTSGPSPTLSLPARHTSISAASPSPSPSTSSQPDRAKRRKVGTACVTCQKAHVSCEEKRPCQRCIRRGEAHLCTDAPRKAVLVAAAKAAAAAAGLEDCNACPIAKRPLLPMPPGAARPAGVATGAGAATPAPLLPCQQLKKARAASSAAASRLKARVSGIAPSPSPPPAAPLPPPPSLHTSRASSTGPVASSSSASPSPLAGPGVFRSPFSTSPSMGIVIKTSSTPGASPSPAPGMMPPPAPPLSHDGGFFGPPPGHPMGPPPSSLPHPSLFTASEMALVDSFERLLDGSRSASPAPAAHFGAGLDLVVGAPAASPSAIMMELDDPLLSSTSSSVGDLAPPPPPAPSSLGGPVPMPCGLSLADLQALLGPLDASFSDLLASCGLDASTPFSAVIPPCMPVPAVSGAAGGEAAVVDLENLAGAWANTVKECKGEGGEKCGSCPVGMMKRKAEEAAAAAAAAAAAKEAAREPGSPVTMFCADGSTVPGVRRPGRLIPHRELAFEEGPATVRVAAAVKPTVPAEDEGMMVEAPAMQDKEMEGGEVVDVVEEQPVEMPPVEDVPVKKSPSPAPVPVPVVRFKNPIGDIQSYDYAKGYRRLERFLFAHLSSTGRTRVLTSFARLQPAFKRLAVRGTQTASDALASELALRTVIAEHLGAIGTRGASILSPPGLADDAHAAGGEPPRPVIKVPGASGLPAVVIWRRTGEVVAVGEAFSDLLGLEAARLVFGAGCGPGTACGRGDPDGVGIGIHEVLSEDSCVELYERFAEAVVGGVDGGAVGGKIERCAVRDPRIGISCSFGGPDELAYPVPKAREERGDGDDNVPSAAVLAKAAKAAKGGGGGHEGSDAATGAACAANGPEGSAAVARNRSMTCELSFQVRRDFKGLPIAVVGTFVPVTVAEETMSTVLATMI